MKEKLSNDQIDAAVFQIIKANAERNKSYIIKAIRESFPEISKQEIADSILRLLK